jgi:MFS family permease
MCGLVDNAAAFYVFRGLAGVGGGGVTNLSMIIVSDIVTLEQRGKYQGIIGAMVGLGNVLGPFLAAAFIEKAGSWRGFFYMLAPLAAISGAISFFLLPSKPPSGRFRDTLGKIDYLGWFASSVAVTFLLIPISGGTCIQYYHFFDYSIHRRVLEALTVPLVRWRILLLDFPNGNQYACHWELLFCTVRSCRMETREASDDAG